MGIRRTGRRRLFLAGAVCLVLFGVINGPAAQAAPSGYPVTGIDVSAFQGTVDWPTVVTTGISFTYIRASEQANIPDSYFSANYRAAKANGLYAGAYHRARPNVSGGRAQAAYLLSQAQYANDGRTLPPMLDIEWPRSNWTGVNACYNMTPAQLVAWMRDFVDEVKIRTGRLAMIYTNPNWWGPCTSNNATFGAYPLFNSGYLPSPPPLPAGWTKWTFWQYTNSLTVPGISGNVDGDVFNGTPAELAELAGAVAANDGTDFTDLNADGRAEAVSFWGSNPTQNYAYLNVNGYGPIDRDQYAHIATGFVPGVSTHFADLDGDGRAEIITISGSPPRVYAYRNINGFGPYDGSQVKLVATGFAPAQTKFADLDGDRRAEIISFWSSSPYRVYAYRNVNGWGLYDGNQYKLVATGFQAARTKFADLDGDGRAEIISFWSSPPYRVYAYRNVNGWGPYDGGQFVYLGNGFQP